MRQHSKIIFITGVSSGLGRALADVALTEGYCVVGTLRKEEERAAFSALRIGSSIGILLDVTDISAIAPKIDEVESEIGPIDVLVNNAGYGYEGIIEESPLHEMRAQFEVNVFGAVAVTKAVLPYMRKRRSGHILNITSVGGIVANPGLGYYHASKFALEGFSEALAKEMKDLGVRVTAVEPGGFRTDWGGRSMIRAGRSISDYDVIFDPLRMARYERDGKQVGDPRKAAQAMLKVVASDEPPTHLLLGNDAISWAREKLEVLNDEIARWESVTRSTDFSA
jgi:NAD(P)-dependent dehydrogenase (short-subunit alcohol dehydrogenase family)